MKLSSQIVRIPKDGADYAPSVLQHLGSETPPKIWSGGPLSILQQIKTGFFCSSQCPGAVVLKTFDAITRMRDEGQVLIGGFHSVMEWECLGILLRGRQPVIWVPARSIVGMHLKPELVPAFEAERLLILSPFPPNEKRITAALAEERNCFVAALTDRIFVPHAASGSKTLALVQELALSGKQILTIKDTLNAPLFDMGAVSIEESNAAA